MNEDSVGAADSDHVTICKFDNGEEPQRYLPVWQGIMDIVELIDVPSLLFEPGVFQPPVQPDETAGQST